MSGYNDLRLRADALGARFNTERKLLVDANRALFAHLLRGLADLGEHCPLLGDVIINVKNQTSVLIGALEDLTPPAGYDGTHALAMTPEELTERAAEGSLEDVERLVTQLVTGVLALETTPELDAERRALSRAWFTLSSVLRSLRA